MAFSIRVQNEFDEMNLHPALRQAIREMEWHKPTTIQSRAIPLALDASSASTNRAFPASSPPDLICVSKTGSGKTGAFLIPIIQDLLNAPAHNASLILTPTRELANQIHEQIELFSQSISAQCGPIKTLRVIGGGGDEDSSASAQMNSAINQKFHVIVATPGRLAYIIGKLQQKAAAAASNKKQFVRLQLFRTRILVLDEADKLLTSKFQSSLDAIFDHLESAASAQQQQLQREGALTKKQQKRAAAAAAAIGQKRRRVFLFSATMTNQIGELEGARLCRPIRIDLNHNHHQPDHKETTAAVDASMNGSSQSLASATSIPERITQRALFIGAQDRLAWLLWLLSSPHTLGSIAASPPHCITTTTNSQSQSANECAALSEARPIACQRVLVFVHTCRDAQLLELALKHVASVSHSNSASSASTSANTANLFWIKLFANAASLHSKMSQRARSDAMQRFRDGDCALMIATDVLSRGVDVPHIEVVINYGWSGEAQSYVHRVGRTGRAGRPGLAISLVTPCDVPAVFCLERFIKNNNSNNQSDSDSCAGWRLPVVRSDWLATTVQLGSASNNRNSSGEWERIREVATQAEREARTQMREMDATERAKKVRKAERASQSEMRRKRRRIARMDAAALCSNGEEQRDSASSSLDED